MPTFKALQSFVVDAGKKNGYARLTLETSNGVTEVSLRPKQAEALVAAILEVRFDLPRVVIEHPKRKRRSGTVYAVLRSAPRPLGPRPSLSEEALRAYPSARAKLKNAQDAWDRKMARSRKRRGPEPSGLF
jgi:hypothetical protein